MSRITLSGVGKSYGHTTVLSDIDLDVAEGEFLVLLGASGSGKSTTLRLVSGLEEVSTGTVAFGDRVLSSVGSTVPANKRQVGFVFQSYALWPHLTVLQNVVYPLHARGVSRSSARTQALEVLDRVQLADFADRPIGALSGGQQQRVALARATVGEPRIILFDEPLSNLDTQLRAELRGRIKELHRQLGFTALYVTHDHGEALALADRIAVFQNGRIVQLGTADEIFSRPGDRFVAEFVGFDNFIDAEVVATQHDGLQFRSLAGALSGSVRTPAAPAAAGEKITVATRAGAFEVLPVNETGESDLPARVVSLDYAGQSFVADVLVGGTRLRGVLPLSSWGFAPEAAVAASEGHVVVRPEWATAHVLEAR